MTVASRVMVDDEGGDVGGDEGADAADDESVDAGDDEGGDAADDEGEEERQARHGDRADYSRDDMGCQTCFGYSRDVF